jgi:hypothetical protein
LPHRGDTALLKSGAPAMRNQGLVSIGVFVLGLWAAWQIGDKIAGGQTQVLLFGSLGFVACVVAVAILRNWRSGFYLFLIWLLFEDLVRKYLGNGTILFFGKDVLVGLVYISFFAALRRRTEKAFRPLFLFPFALFVWLAAAQVFNPNSPSILYGLLGFKLYFCYVPLMFVGYALVRVEDDLRKFLVVNAFLAGVISLLGIIQAILGNSFLNPAHLAPELEELGNLYKVSPLTGHIVSLPDSVFVSSGRYGLYLIFVTIFMVGAAGYLVLYTERSRKLIFVVIALVGGAVLFSGGRGPVMYVIGSTLVMAVGLLWGAPWRHGQAHRSLKAVRRSLTMATLGLAFVMFVFPEEAGSRIALYAETLLPSSSAYEVSARTWDYPMANFLDAFNKPNWLLGNGTGLASLGTQYVSKLIGQRPPNIGVEEGYGSMIVEMGIIAPFLWLLWTGALVYHCWKIVARLRGTRFFPIGFAIWWYTFLLLFPLTYGGLTAYQNYINNAYMWLLVGVLYRLPELLLAAPSVATAHKTAARGGFEF